MINLSEIARGRRIVAMMARELSLTRSSNRPDRPGLVKRMIRHILG